MIAPTLSYIENQFHLFEIINLNLSLCNNVHLPCVNKVDKRRKEGTKEKDYLIG